MSLKAFHLFFVCICTVFLLALGGWALREYNRSGESQPLVIAILACVGGVGMIFYGWYFLRKLRGVSYI